MFIMCNSQKVVISDSSMSFSDLDDIPSVGACFIRIIKDVINYNNFVDHIVL